VPAEREFERVILPHLDSAYNLACWLIGDRSIAEDVVQDAVLRALNHFASCAGGDARLWLLRIVRNSAYSILRERCIGVEVSLDGEDGRIGMDVPEPGVDPEMVVAKQEDLARLNSALAALPVELRECLVLHEVEELSYKEIARIADVPIGAVMSRLWRARQALTSTSMQQGKRLDQKRTSV
jgi:RNA polymerase sigma factor (sigma-70 family)